MQSITVIGHVGQAAKIQDVNGRKAINFSVAANKSYKNKDGVKTTVTTWYSCTRWIPKENSGEIAKYLKQGTQVCVQGEPSARLFEGKNGVQVSIDIDVKLLELLQSAKKEENKSNPEKEENSRTPEGGGVPANEEFSGE